MSLRVADDGDTRGFLTRGVAWDVVPALFSNSGVVLREGCLDTSNVARAEVVGVLPNLRSLDSGRDVDAAKHSS